jgi:hypothetical protein
LQPSVSARDDAGSSEAAAAGGASISFSARKPQLASAARPDVAALARVLGVRSLRRIAQIRLGSSPLRARTIIGISGLSRRTQLRFPGSVGRAQSFLPLRNHVCISPLPLTSMAPRFSSMNDSLNRCRVESVTCIRPATPWDSIRLAVFTTSPHKS